MPREGVVLLVAGQQKSGKTFSANHLIRRDKYVLAYDQTGLLLKMTGTRFDRFDGLIVENTKQMTGDMVDSLQLDTGFRIALVDLAAKFRNKFLRIVKKWSEPRGFGREPLNPLTVWFEEAHKTWPKEESRSDPSVKLLDELMRTAAHRRLNFIFTTQDAEDMPLLIRRQINSAKIFRHTQPASVDYVTDVLGDRKFGPTVRRLRQGNFLELTTTGQVFGPKRIRT